MPSQSSKYRPVAFGGTIVAYMLPFVTMSCMGQSETLTGFQVAFGTTIGTQSLQGEPLAIAALLLAILGLFLAKDRSDTFFAMGEVACGAAGAIALLLLHANVQTDAAKNGIGLRFEFGFWMAFVSLACGAVLAMIDLQSPASEGSAAGNFPAER